MAGTLGDRAEVGIDLVEVLGRGPLASAVAEVVGHPLGQVTPRAFAARSFGKLAVLTLFVGHAPAFGWAGRLVARLLTLGLAGLLTGSAGAERLRLLAALLAHLLLLLLRGLVDRSTAGLATRRALVELLVERIQFLRERLRHLRRRGLVRAGLARLWATRLAGLAGLRSTGFAGLL